LPRDTYIDDALFYADLFSSPMITPPLRDVSLMMLRRRHATSADYFAADAA